MHKVYSCSIKYHLLFFCFWLVSSTASGKKTKPLYKKKPSLICVRAFQNGNRDNYARITVPDLQQVHYLIIWCVKCNLTKLTTNTSWYWYFWSVTGICMVFNCMLSSFRHCTSKFQRGSPWNGCFSLFIDILLPLLPFPSPLLTLCDRCLENWVGAYGWVAGLPSWENYKYCVGDGWSQWRSPDITGIHLRHSMMQLLMSNWFLNLNWKFV